MSIVRGLECSYLRNNNEKIQSGEDEFITWKSLLSQSEASDNTHRKGKNYTKLKDRAKENSFEDKLNSMSLKKKTKLEQNIQQNPRLQEQMKQLKK